MAISTPYATLSFPNLFTPRPKVPGGDPVYGCSLLFSPEAQKTQEFANMKEAAQEAFIARFGDKVKPSGAYSNPFRKAEDKDIYAAFGGYVYISPSTKNKPDIIGRNKEEILIPDQVYPGQIVRASLGVFAWEKGGNRGVSFGLNGLQLVKPNAPRIDGRVSLAKIFDEIPNEEMADADGPF